MSVYFRKLFRLPLLVTLPVLLATATANAAADETVTTGPDISVCPEVFHTFPVPANAKQCQRFDTDLPATLVFYASVSNNELIAQYQAAYPGLEKISTVQGRTLLTADNNNIRMVISPDKHGSQVDIMMIETAVYLSKAD